MIRLYKCGRCKTEHPARYWYADIRYARRCGKCTRSMEDEIRRLKSKIERLKIINAEQEGRVWVVQERP